MTITTAPLSLEQLQQIASNPTQVQVQLIALLETMQSDDEEVRAWTADCLQLIEAPNLQLTSQAVDQIADYCKSTNVPAAVWACKMLGKFEELVADSQPYLCEALETHPSVAVRQAAALALGSAIELSDHTREALLQAATTDDPRLKRLCEQALKNH